MPIAYRWTGSGERIRAKTVEARLGVRPEMLVSWGGVVENPDTKLRLLAAEFERLAEKGVRSAPEMQRVVEELRVEFRDLVHQRQELASLYQVAQELAAKMNLGELLESIIDKAIVLVGAERGFVVLSEPTLAGPTPAGLRIATARKFASGEVEPTDEAFSSTLVKRVMQTREPILTTNVQDDGRFELTQSILLQNIRSVLAVPLIALGELQGAVYVDTRFSLRPFDQADLRLLEAMASQAAMAIRGAKLYEEARRSNEQLQQTLKELRETESHLVQAERLAAVGRLAASVAHELRSPLMVMRNAIYFLERLLTQGKVDSPDIFKRYLEKLDSEIDRQNKIINDLLFFSRNRPRKLIDVDLNALLTETLMRVQIPEATEVRKELDLTLSSIHADADQVMQVFVNLITNALQAMPEGGTLTIKTWSEEFYAVTEVSDTGVGIKPENLQHLFEPFFTTKEKGIGLGLAVTHNLVEGHRGRIEVRSTVGVGTVFTVWLPFELVG